MLVQVLVSGIAIGCVYGLIALALVLINKSTDVVNFAQGEMAMFGAFVALALNRDLGLPMIVVLALAFPIGGLIGAVTERIAIRPLAGGAPINALIATIGLWMVFHYGAGWIWGFDPFRFPSLVSDVPIDIAGIRVAPPWRVDISKQVKPGENRIEVLVFNTLANHYLTIPTRYRGELTSGLLGPVTLRLETITPPRK